MRSLRSISRLILAALAGTVILTGGANAEHESEWKMISELDVIVDIYRTGVHVNAVYQIITDNRILYQEVMFSDEYGEGFLRLENWRNVSFTLGSDDAAMGGQALRGAAEEGLASRASDATVELTKKLSILAGSGTSRTRAGTTYGAC